MVSQDFKLQMQGYGLTTALITYRIPDYMHILQEYLYQCYDIAPKFPEVVKFVYFWETKLDGPLHSVKIAHSNLIKPTELIKIDNEFVLH